jgi:ABC-2 type transport system ATP-binding protein
VSVLLVTHELDEAEALCDRVFAMRAGVVLDSGTPAELVDRHGRNATIRFTLPEGQRQSLDLADLGGVHDVTTDGDRVTIRGDRRSIAYVGEALVRGGSIPPDLAVEVPDLEDVLLELLEQHEVPARVADDSRDLIGAPR